MDLFHKTQKKGKNKPNIGIFIIQVLAVLFTAGMVISAIVSLAGFYLGTQQNPLTLIGIPIDYAVQRFLIPFCQFTGIVAGLCWLKIFLRWKTQLQTIYREQAEREERNQAAILRLMDDLGELSNGDLTVEARVTEDFTGAIADAVNYAIESMRDLVITINHTATQVASASSTTRLLADDMQSSSTEQASKIHSITRINDNMVKSLDRVAVSSIDTVDIARNALTIAKEGGQRVHATIAEMDKIRENIQETSKRIKRLGESSQEIGNIVEIIKGIADQTNILALNAAIQASSAGEAGRGFAVVADEIQRLAERSTNATKRIENLVKTIQVDTNEAMSSMENSTSEVVSGANIAEEAGQALVRIETVSDNMASLIEKVSEATQKVSSMAEGILRDMSVINEMTVTNAGNVVKTTHAIDNLSQLSSELKDSVSGFKLPEAES